VRFLRTVFVKVRNGRPTKAEIGKLCDTIGLYIYPLELYQSFGFITFSAAGRPNANEKARKVADELTHAGFTIEFKEARTDQCITGQIRVLKKYMTLRVGKQFTVSYDVAKNCGHKSLSNNSARVESIGHDWVVIRDSGGVPYFYHGDPIEIEGLHLEDDDEC
jgi:hypothetical protein